MKKLLVLSAAMLMAGSASAYADALVIQGTVGNPGYVVAPAPVYQTYPAYVYDDRWPSSYYYNRSHRYNWNYWHDRRDWGRDRRDRDWDHDHNRNRHR